MGEEYQNRIQKLQRHLADQDVDVAMVTSPINVAYYTGFHSNPHERFMGLVIDNRKQKIHLFVPALDEEMATSETSIQNIIPVFDDEDPFVKLKNTLGGDVKKIGVETKIVNMFRHHMLTVSFPDARYVDIQKFINIQRMRKSPAEKKIAQKAVNIAEKVLKAGIEKVEVGMSEQELAAKLEYFMRKYGADGPSFSTIVLSGERSALPHGVPGSRTFRNGDFLLIDMGVVVDGYCSDFTRTFFIGEASDKQKEIYHTVLQAVHAGMDAVQAEVPVKNFDTAARKVIEDKGYGPYFNHRIGHGLGMESHEEPSIYGSNSELAEKGLLLTIEPGIYIPEFGGVRLEDEVFINENGDAEILTSFSKELQFL